MCTFAKYLVFSDRVMGQGPYRHGRQRLYGLGRFALMAICLLVFGCTAPFSDMMQPMQPASTLTEPMTLALSQVEATAEGLQVALSGTQPFSYRMVNHDQPLQLIIDVLQARIEQPEVRTVGYGGIKAMRLSQVSGAETWARFEIDLADDAVYHLVKEHKQLAVRVRTPASQAQPRTVALQAPRSDPPKVLPETTPGAPKTKEYKVGAGDTLAITVYDEPDLTLQRRVTERGLVDFPLIGKVQVAGMTATQVEERIEARLSPGYLLDPQVFVDVVEFASKKVFIVGAVAKPMALTLRGETTLLEVLSQTENLSQSRSLTIFRRVSKPEKQSADHNDVKAIHVDLGDLLHRGNMSNNLILQAQDVVYIPKPDAVFVFGEVARTGPVAISEGGMTLVEAINKAGGFSDFAASKRTRVLRMVDGQEKVIHVDMAAVIRGDLGKNITLRSNDIVIVPESVF